jgi:hypothetical protein
MEISEQPQQDSQSKEQLQARATEKMFGLSPETPNQEPTEEGAEQAIEEGAEESLEESVETEAASDVEEVEYEGKTFKVPKEIKDALLRQSDYTRKTQEVAEARRAVAEESKLIKAQQEFHASIIDDIGQLRAIDSQLGQYQNLNWGQMDTDTLVRTKHQFDQLKDVKQSILNQINMKQGEFNKRREMSLGEMRKAGQQLLTQKISGFNEKTQQEISAFLAKEGYTDSEIGSIYDARQVALAWKALQYDKLQMSKPNIQNRAKNAPPVIKPGASQKTVSKDAALMHNFRNAKSYDTRQKLGAEILAKKLGV